MRQPVRIFYGTVKVGLVCFTETSDKNTTKNLVLFSKTLPLLQIRELLKSFMFIDHNFFYYRAFENTHLCPFNKSKFNLKSDRVNLPAPVSPIKCLVYLTNVRAIQYKLGPERLTRLGNSNLLRLPVRRT